jgi:hypothetical protein
VILVILILALLSIPAQASHVATAVSSFFQDEINLVDSSKTLVCTLNTSTYDDFEFSYSGLTVTAGSHLGCEYGFSELMEEMGFRWYAPDTGAGGNQGRFTVRPGSIPTTLTAAKQSFWFDNSSLFLTYGHSWAGSKAASRTLLTDAQKKWAVLNGLQTSAFPVGHRHGGIVLANKAYFEANPTYLKNGLPIVGSQPPLNLGLEDTDVPGWNNIVMISAAQILKEGLNAWHNTHFDPADGDTHTTDQVIRFTNAVIAKVRAGTDAIGTHPARTGVSDARIGIYVYAGHRLPPTITVNTGIYAQLVLGFNNTGLTFQQLFDQWGAKMTDAASLFIREYGDTHTWSNGQPGFNARAKCGYFDVYDDFQEAGANGNNNEYSGNWLNNLVQARYMIRKMRAGSYSCEEAIDDVVGDLFADDPDVRDLFELWYNPSEGYNRYSLRQMFDLVSAMTDSWYKTYFEQQLVIVKERDYLPKQTPLKGTYAANPFATTSSSAVVTITHASHNHATGNSVTISGAAACGGITLSGSYSVTKINANSYSVTHGSAATSAATCGGSVATFAWPVHDAADPYALAVSSYLSKVTGTRDAGIDHSYARIRRDAAQLALATNYPTLMYFASPEPNWFANPVAPTLSDFTTAHTAIIDDTPHDTDLDNPDVVMVRGITPTVAGTAAATKYLTQYQVHYILVCSQTSCTVTLTPAGDNGIPISGAAVTTTTYGSGVHHIYFIEDVTIATHNGGYLFLDGFPSIYKRSDGTALDHWLYIPTRLDGATDIKAKIRWRVTDNNGLIDIIPSTSTGYVSPATLGPGQVKINNANTIGEANIAGANAYISERSDIALMPRQIAEEDFTAYSRINVP